MYGIPSVNTLAQNHNTGDKNSKEKSKKQDLIMGEQVLNDGRKNHYAGYDS